MCGIVYKLSCQNCLVNYIGESGRRLRDRMSEHKNYINNRKQNFNVYAHVRDFSHVFDFENVKSLINVTKSGHAVNWKVFIPISIQML